MKIRRSEMILRLGLFIVSISNCDSHSDKHQPQSYDLNILQTIGTGQTDSIYFAYPTALELDEKKCIYVLDYKQSAIFKFSPTGRYLQTMCGPGRGPGELSSPTELDYDEGIFIIKDGGNGRIQLVDSLGTYKDSFQGGSLPSPLVSLKNKIYGLAIRELKDNLITVFDRKGRRLNEFGSLLDFSKKLSLFANNCFLEIYKDHLYIL